jgi:hypothetical protein
LFTINKTEGSKIVTIVLILAAIVSLSGCTTVTSPAGAGENQQTLTESDFKAQCQDVAVSDLMGNTDTYVGQYVRIPGRIVNFEESATGTTMIMAVTDPSYILPGGLLPVYVSYPGKTTAFINDDVTVYGVFYGNDTPALKSIQKTTLPMIDAKYIDFKRPEGTGDTAKTITRPSSNADSNGNPVGNTLVTTPPTQIPANVASEAPLSSRKNPLPPGMEYTYSPDSYASRLDGYTINIKLLEVVKGDEANRRVAASTQWPPDLPATNNFLLAHFRIDLTNSPSDKVLQIQSNSLFEAVSDGMKIYEGPGYTFNPSIYGEIYQGGTLDGWVCLQVAKSDKNPLIVMDRHSDGTGGVWFRTDNSPAVIPAVTTNNPGTQGPASLPTGSFLRKNLDNGYGELQISNGLPTDAVISIAKTTSPLVIQDSVYIQGADAFTVSGIPDGDYLIYYKTGTDWNSVLEKFNQNGVYRRFEDSVHFTTTSGKYTTWQIEIKPVAGGNAKTENIDPSVFPA